MKMILAPVDFSDVTASVVDQAARLAKMSNGYVVLLHVVRPIQAALGYEMDSDRLTELTDSMERAAGRELGRVKAALQRRGVSTQGIQLTGSPGELIMEQAAKLRAAYIVMGSHGHTALYDLIIGSTTSTAIKRASCPVVIVPRPRKVTKAK